ncbi:MAG: zf-HC2 domain-containing protein [Chloroflexi bacterium]|nr:zf-HC2 domain-containing protein [Chloroflexota bacterium]
MIGFLERRKHDRLRTLLSSFADAEVSESETRDVETHLAHCAECAAELASIRGMSQLLRGLPELALPRSFVLSHAPAPVRQAAYGLWTGTFATAAAAVLLVVLLVGDAVGLVTQSPLAAEELRTREAFAPAAAVAPAAPAAAPAPPTAALRSASSPAGPTELTAEVQDTLAAPSLPAPALAAPAPAASAPAPPTPDTAPALADVSGFAGAAAEAPAEAVSSQASAPAAAAPAAATTLEAAPTPGTEVQPLAQAEILATPDANMFRTLTDPLPLSESPPESSEETPALESAVPIAPETVAAPVQELVAKPEAGGRQPDAALESQGRAAPQPQPAPAQVDTSQSALSTDAAPPAEAPSIPALAPKDSSRVAPGIPIPLRQLQVATAAALAVLLAATISMYRRRHRP